MDDDKNVLRKSGSYLANIAGICFIAVLVLVTTNVITRLFRVVIPGVYELTGLIMLGGGAFALAYAALFESNVEITLLTDRMPKQVKKAFKVFSWLLCTLLWGFVCWRTVMLVLERGLRDRTSILHVVLMPSRICWVIGLAFLTIICLYNTVNTSRR